MEFFLLFFIIAEMSCNKSLAIIVFLLLFNVVPFLSMEAAERIDGENVNTVDVEDADNTSEFTMPMYVNDIVAIVNNEVVTMGQLMQEVAFFIPQIRKESHSQKDFHEKLKECQNIVLNAFIERILIVEDFKAKGGKVPDSFENKEYETHIHDRFNDDRVAFANYLRNNGKSIRDFKKDIRESAIVGFVLYELKKSHSAVSPAQISEYYAKNIDRYIIDRKFKLVNVELEKSKYPGEKLQDKIKQVCDVLASEQNNVQAAAAKLSDFPKTSNIGWVTLADLRPELSNVVKELSIGECSLPIEIENKICILFISEEKPAKKFTIEEVQEDIVKKISTDQKINAKNNYINNLKKKAYVKIFL